jgi:ubiquitin-conjugating enzyme E2 J2
MSKAKCHKRIMRDLRVQAKTPNPLIHFVPESETNLQTVYYLIHGLADCEYADGYYIGEIKFPDDYPFKAPSIKMHTPSGRFTPGQTICINGISHYHAENWSPETKLEGVLVSLVSFMTEPGNHHHVAAMNDSIVQRKTYASNSREYNEKKISKMWKLFESYLSN